MTLIVCPLHAVSEEISRSSPARLISLLAPDQPTPDTTTVIPRLTLRFHDICTPRCGLTAPDSDMVGNLLAFGAAWIEPGPLLVHCWMGISRSTAAAFALACAADPSRSELAIARALRKASPTATPNPLIVALADRLLNRNGRLILAAASIGQGENAVCGSAFRLTVSRASIGS